MGAEPLSSETRHPPMSCGNEGQRQAHSRLRVCSRKDKRVRESPSEKERSGKGGEIEGWKENVKSERGEV